MLSNGVDPLYDIEISTSPDFTKLSASGTTVTPIYTPTASLGGGTYFWQERAITNAEISDWSQVWWSQMTLRAIVLMVVNTR